MVVPTGYSEDLIQGRTAGGSLRICQEAEPLSLIPPSVPPSDARGYGGASPAGGSTGRGDAAWAINGGRFVARPYDVMASEAKPTKDLGEQKLRF